ncbi:hypothetical protein [Desulfonatronospira sp.]|nr:hypothetical protein [Desulfonatronospira sp.]
MQCSYSNWGSPRDAGIQGVPEPSRGTMKLGIARVVERLPE